MLVTSTDPLAAYKVSDDLILELVNVTATVEDDSEALRRARAGFRLSNLTNWSNTNRTEGICSTIAKSK